MSIFNKISYIYNELSNKYTECEMSCDVNKDYNQVIKFAKEILPKGFFKSSFGRLEKDVSIGNTHIIVRTSEGKHSGLGEMCFNIMHIGNVTTKVIIKLYCTNAKKHVEDFIEQIKHMPDCKLPEKNSANDFKIKTETTDEAIKQFNEALDSYATKQNEETLNKLIATKVNLVENLKKYNKDISEKCSQHLSNIDLYISTLQTQNSNPITAASSKQFIPTYINQIRFSVTQIENIINLH